jgi:hypothetical protein
MNIKQKFPEKTFALSSNFEPDLPAGIVNKFMLKFDGLVTAGGGGAVAGLTCDSPANLLQNLAVALGKDKLIDIRMIDLFWLSALINKRTSQIIAGTPGAGTSAAFAINADLPLNLNLLPAEACFIDGRKEKLIVKGKFGALADYASTNMAALAGTLRAGILNPSQVPEGAYLRPRFNQKDMDISSVSSNIPDYIQFAESCICVGLLLRQYDSSAVGNAQRTDGIVRQLTIKLSGSYKGEIYDGKMGEIKNETSNFFGLPLAELPVGIGFIPFLDDSNELGFREIVKGDRLDFKIDTFAAVEDDITAVVAAASDKLIVTPIIFEHRVF